MKNTPGFGRADRLIRARPLVAPQQCFSTERLLTSVGAVADFGGTGFSRCVLEPGPFEARP
jgi:hypothetical protein